MNDSEIRKAYHGKRLGRRHCDPGTLVVDELGLQHGRCRADIAVVNGHLLGYEIKSDVDSLHRLPLQIDAYGLVFDRVTAVVTTRHLEKTLASIPAWWAVEVATQGARGAVHFEIVRRGQLNPRVDAYAVSQLLWRNEAAEILERIGAERVMLRASRSQMYSHLVQRLGRDELRREVSRALRTRENWRVRPLPSGDGGSSQRIAKW
jgi:hypothetical protein